MPRIKDPQTSTNVYGSQFFDDDDWLTTNDNNNNISDEELGFEQDEVPQINISELCDSDCGEYVTDDDDNDNDYQSPISATTQAPASTSGEMELLWVQGEIETRVLPEIPELQQASTSVENPEELEEVVRGDDYIRLKTPSKTPRVFRPIDLSPSPALLSKDKKTTWVPVFPSTARTKSSNIRRDNPSYKPGPCRIPEELMEQLQQEKGEKSDSSIKKLFKLYYTDDIRDEVLRCTNDFIRNKMNGKPFAEISRIELDAYIGLRILIGVNHKPSVNVRSYWRPHVGGLPICPATMGLKRFCFIRSVLRFDDVLERRDRVTQAKKEKKEAQAKAATALNLAKEKPTPINKKAAKVVVEEAKTAGQYDRLGPIRNIWEKFVANLPLYFIPGDYLTLDERIVKFWGRCEFKTYIPSKPTPYGLKEWALVDTGSKYVCFLQLYTGKKDGKVEKDQARRVVLDLTRQYFGTGRGVCADNWFTSLECARELEKNGLTYVGTIKKNRVEVPAYLTEVRGREPNSTLFYFTEKADALLVSYIASTKSGSKVVNLLSTEHTHGLPLIDQAAPFKPEVIHDYNCTKYGVDVVDEMTSNYSVKAKSPRWPTIMHDEMIDIGVHDAYIVFKHLQPNRKFMYSPHQEFMEQLAYQLMWPAICERKIQSPMPQCTRLAFETMAVREKCFCLPQPQPPPPAQTTLNYFVPKKGNCQQKEGNGNCKRSTRNACQTCKLRVCSTHEAAKTVTEIRVCYACVVTNNNNELP